MRSQSNRSLNTLILLLFVGAGCSSASPGAGTGVGWDADSSGGDGKGIDSASVDGVDAGSTDVDDTQGIADTGQTDDISSDDVDWSDLLDPQDANSDDTSTPVKGPVGQLYAQTKDSLYRLDLAAGQFTLVGKFTFDKNTNNVTDIALDAGGKLYAVTDHDLYVCESSTAKCKWQTTLPGSGTFNGLTFVPKGTVDPNKETLIGIGTDGAWDQIDFSTGVATVKQLGSYGGGWLSSGDSFSVEGVGTYATIKGKSKTDSLAQVDPKTGAIVQVIGETGVNQLFGFAWWQGVFYGFSNDGNVYIIDVTTGKATPIKGIKTPSGAKWWGAGVSTRANG